MNTGASAAPIHLKFFADVTGTPLPLPLSFQEGGGTTRVASSVDQTLAAGVILFVQSTAELSDPAPTVGSAQLITAGNVSGFVIFRYRPNGQEAVVPLESRNAIAYIVAFVNTGGSATLSLAANGHLAFTLGSDKYPATAKIRGNAGVRHAIRQTDWCVGHPHSGGTYVHDAAGAG